MLISNLQAASLYAANAQGKSTGGQEEVRGGMREGMRDGMRETGLRERTAGSARRAEAVSRPTRPAAPARAAESAPVSISPAARLAAEAESQARRETAQAGEGAMSYAQRVAANYRELLQKHGMVDTQAHYQQMLSEGAESEAERQAFIAQAKADARLMTLLPGIGQSGRR